MTTAPTRLRYTLPLSTKLQFLQTYRLLLRETTYLPDTHARTYWQDYIKKRFRAYRPRVEKQEWAGEVTRIFIGRPIPSPRRASMLLDSSRAFLRTLCRANEGFPASLVTVLRHSYGRIGRRKHELLAPYLVPDLLDDDDAVQKMLSGAAHVDRADNKLPISDALRAIATAQKSLPSGNIPGPVLRRVDPAIPQKNIWCRPMPIRRVRNVKIKALKNVVERIMPPLPTEEWERLKSLAHGKISCGSSRERRAGWHRNANQREPLLVKQKTHHLGPRRLTKRMMKRFWASIFVQCPVVEKHATNGTWTAKFGQVSKQGILPPVSREEQGWMFKGTDSTAQALGYWSEYNRLHRNNPGRKKVLRDGA
jgi:hypothetical protein